MSKSQRYAMLATSLIESGSLLRLGSLRQLILGSFLVALVPLAALLWQSQTDLARVSQLTVKETQHIASLVSKVQQLESASVVLERALRQYQVLKNDVAAGLVENAIGRFSEQHGAICDVEQRVNGCVQLRQTVTTLRGFRAFDNPDMLANQLTLMRQQLADIDVSVDDAIAERLVVQQQDVSAMQVRQTWLSALLVSVSLALILLGSQLIINPVRKLKLIIRMLARQQGHLPPLSTKAPRELAGVEQDLHWLGERLAQLEHIRTALLRHAAHELKTPLASMKEGCALLSDGSVGELSGPQQEVMSLINASTTRLNTLIEKLLDYNLLLQQAQPKFTLVDVDHMVKQCIGDYKLALQKHKLDIDLACKSITADEELLRRILDNLVSNAVAHGALDKTIHVRLSVDEHNAYIDVANDGKKIPKEKISSLFEPFIRGEGARNDNVIGTGLGLSIVADCARIMHGDATVIDVDYADVCFRVRIPQQEEKH